MQKIFALPVLLVCLLCRLPVCAQPLINGVVKDTAGPLPAATVSLLATKDSAWISSVLADDKGAFAFLNVAAGNYLISVTAPGYATVLQAVGTGAVTVMLHKESTALREVAITGKKPFIEMSIDKVTVNVDGSPTAIGMNMLDLLRKMPGITVDQKGNISMQSKQGVLVLIDDRPTYLSAEELAEYLKTIPSDEIAQVELMTQPSARYDAAGNAGVINLKRKKNRKEGLSGTGTVTLGQGVYPYALASAFVSYRKNKLSLSLSGDEHEGMGFADWQETQLLKDAIGNTASVTNIHSTSFEHFSIANLRLAADYDLTAKATIGASVKVAYHTNAFTDRVSSDTYDVPGNTNSYDTIVSPDGFVRKDLTGNAYYLYKFNSERTLSISLDYITYANSPYQSITNTMYDENLQPLPDPLLLYSHQPSLINVYSIKGDYTDTLSNGTKLEAGFKSSFVKTDDNAAFTIFQNSAWVADTLRSNHFLYKENINAMYVSASKVLGPKWEAKAGLRAENTNAQGIQQVGNSEFSKSYVSLFPTAYISCKADKDNQLELNYGRRIDRPSYQSLNPFIFYSFQYSYSVGNPALQPQFTNSIELKHSYKNMFISTIGISRTNGTINDILVANSTTGVVYNTKQNTGINDIAYLSVIFNKDLYKWWSLNAGTTLFYNNCRGAADGGYLINKGPGWSGNLASQFSFIKGWKAEGDVYYSGKYIESIIATSLPAIYMSVGVSKKLSAAGTLKLSVEDPFYLSRFKKLNTLPGLYTSAVFRNSTRSVALAYTWSFGNSPSKQHDVNATDEAKRIK